MKKILLVTGPGGEAQGWGDMAVTKAMDAALNASGVACETAYVENAAGFERVVGSRSFDIVWSALYHFSDRADIVAVEKNAVWAADILDEKGIPYVGPNAATMKNLIRKSDTHEIMRAAGAPTPQYNVAKKGGALPNARFPAFVKPVGESRSVGISDDSVVHDSRELARQVAFIHHQLGQDALIEDYLPGDEYTVLMLGNGDRRQLLPGLVTVEQSRYGKYKILRSDLRGVGLTRVLIPNDAAKAREAADAAGKAMLALNCVDHVRADLRADAEGRLRVIEVNGIPGLKPGKSWSPQIYSMYHPAPGGMAEEYKNLLKVIADAAFARINCGG
ncbi:MAG: hypothetical protein PHP98_12215 [Kiritimatiellae bacterium]|nr:hypothetical protein [Kiritimatiellia bacterium]